MNLENGYSVIMREVHCARCEKFSQFTAVIEHGKGMYSSTGAAISIIRRNMEAAGWKMIGCQMTCPKHRKAKKAAH